MSETITPLYSGSFENFRWAGFGSGSGTNLQQCAQIKKPALIFSDRAEAPLLKIPELSSSETFQLIISGHSFCGRWKEAQGNPQKENEYHQRTEEFNSWILQNLRQYEAQHGSLDLIVLGGYMRMVTEPLLSAYKDKIINVHPADLSVLTLEKRRKYVGAHAVRDALAAGEPSTKSSVILVDGKMDHGEILTQGPEVAIDTSQFSASSSFEDYVRKHQQRQKEQSDWPALVTAFSFLAQGRLAVGKENLHFNEWRRVYLDGEHLPYSGYVISSPNEVEKHDYH